MSTTAVVLTIMIVVVLVVVIGLVAASMRKKSRQDNAARAAQLREQADAEAAAVIPGAHAQATAAEAEAARARHEAQQAEERAAVAKQDLTQQQAAHEDQIRAADRLDPDVDTRADDYSPRTILDDSTTAAPETARPVDGTEYDADGRPIDDPHHTGPRFDGEGRPTQRRQGGSHRA